MVKYASNKQIISWALYDWANSAYAVTVMTVFFPIFLKDYWGAGTDVTESTFQLGLANSVAGVLVVILAPILGAIADRSSSKKKFLIMFATIGIALTASLYFVEKGNMVHAVFIYIFATLGFMGSNIFSDSLLTDVSSEKDRERVSSLGYALGYLGGGLLFSINVAMTLWPDMFGLEDKTEAVKIAFISVALWWAVFTIPLVVFVREAKNTVAGLLRRQARCACGVQLDAGPGSAGQCQHSQADERGHPAGLYAELSAEPSEDPSGSHADRASVEPESRRASDRGLLLHQ